MTLYLWDASDFDWGRGSLDLGAAKKDGITGFSHKATEATWVKHVHTGEALARARDAGMEFIGAYHVVRSTSPTEQVDYFLNYLDQVSPWWRNFPGFFLQVDLELWSYDRVTAATGKAFTEALIAAQDKKVVLYASRGQYGNQLTGIPAPLWNAAYGTNPAVHYPNGYRGDNDPYHGWDSYSGQVPTFLQYGSRLTIGTQSTCDCSAFRGSLDDLRAVLGEDMPTTDEIAQAVWSHVVSGIDYHDMRDQADGYTGPVSEHLKWVVNDHNFLVALDKKLDQVIALLEAGNGGGGMGLTHEQLVEAAREGAELAEDS